MVFVLQKTFILGISWEGEGTSDVLLDVKMTWVQRWPVILLMTGAAAADLCVSNHPHCSPTPHTEVNHLPRQRSYLPTLQSIPSYSPARSQHIVLYYHRAQGKLTEQPGFKAFPRHSLSNVIVYIRHPILSGFYNALRCIYFYFMIECFACKREG